MTHKLRMTAYLLAAFFSCQSASGMDAKQHKEALSIITDAAEKICSSIPTEGGRTAVQLTGEAKAKIDLVTARIANLGIEGTANYNSEEYKGLLQRDLANALAGNQDCKKAIFESLVDRLIPKPPARAAEGGEQNPALRWNGSWYGDIVWENPRNTCWGNVIEIKISNGTFQGKFGLNKVKGKLNSRGRIVGATPDMGRAWGPDDFGGTLEDGTIRSRNCGGVGRYTLKRQT